MKPKTARFLLSLIDGVHSAFAVADWSLDKFLESFAFDAEGFWVFVGATVVLSFIGGVIAATLTDSHVAAISDHSSVVLWLSFTAFPFAVYVFFALTHFVNTCVAAAEARLVTKLKAVAAEPESLPPDVLQHDPDRGNLTVVKDK